MHNITIVTVHGEYEFIGKHITEQETTDWRYYETSDGILYDFKKEHIVCAISVEIDDDV